MDLEVLRKIGKTICLSAHDVMGSEIQKTYQYQETLEKTMMIIVEGLDQEQRDTIMRSNDWSTKIHELLGLAKEYCVFETLKDVVKLLEGESLNSPKDDESTSERDIETESEEVIKEEIIKKANIKKANIKKENIKKDNIKKEFIKGQFIKEESE